MKRVWAIYVGFTWLAGVGPCAGLQSPPNWAYGTEPSPAAATPATAGRRAPDTSLKHLAGSDQSFTAAQIGDIFGPADWFPEDHPKMPGIVAFGRKPQVWACALCHYPNGKGRPENAGVSGLPVSYFLVQMKEFREGERHSADPRKHNTNIMISIAKAMTPTEIQQAADYFGVMKWTPWIRVVETDTVPKTRLSVGMYLPLESGGREPLGQRIIEMPENVEQTEGLRNPRSGFVAYVPKGSVEKGGELVRRGSGKTVPCGVCHGADLNGLGPVPGIAGRSPSYLARQMFDMQRGTRHGEWTELMKPVVSNLNDEDVLNIVAYAASLKP